MSDLTYVRNGNLAIFNQYGIKLNFKNSVSTGVYYNWLDEIKAGIGTMVEGAAIAEKSYARTEPRLNTGVYYDTVDYKLLRGDMVLRTTCNKKTHAFCAFKLGENSNHIRRDYRYNFEGEEKLIIQNDPISKEAMAIVKKLLSRDDIEHTGTHLKNITGISGEELMPSLCIEQYRHPFFVWLDKRDALRCSMDRVQTYDLRLPEDKRIRTSFSEIELPIYPHIEDDVANDARVRQLIYVLSESLRSRFDLEIITDSKYQRAAKLLKII